MEVISTNDGILCNAEVMSILKEQPCKEGGNLFGNRQALESQLSGYFSSQDMSIITGNISNFISACRSKDIDLTKAEYLQVFNLLPTSVVEIHLIVEECSERLSEEQVDYLVETVERIFLKT